MMTEKKLEEVFKDALGNYEADVSPSLFQSVQSGLAGKGAAVSGVSGAAQAGNTMAGLGVKGMLWIASAVVISGAGLYFAFSGPAAKESPGTEAKTESSISSAVESTVVQDHQPAISIPEKDEAQNKKINTPIVVSPSPAPVESKQHTDVKTTDPVIASQPASSGIQKIAGHVTPASHKADEEVRSSEVKELSAAEPEPAKTAATAAEDPSFDQIEKYLLADQLGQKMLPNKFTPDGDGFNDEFTLQTTGLQSIEVTLFNQRGMVITKWNDLHGRWNGNLSNGAKADAGNYYYSVKAVTYEGKICIAQSTLILSR